MDKLFIKFGQFYLFIHLFCFWIKKKSFSTFGKKIDFKRIEKENQVRPDDREKIG